MAAITGLVASAKLDAVTPLAKVKPLGSVTASVVLLRFASVSVERLATTAGRGRTSAWNVSAPWSPAARFASASCAVRVEHEARRQAGDRVAQRPVAAGTWNSVMGVPV